MKPTGYYRLDHRGTQGITIRDGRPVLSGKDGGLEEWDLVPCVHCQARLKMRPGDASATPDGAGFCARCAGYHCPTEQCSICTPFMKAIDAAEDREYHRQQFARVAGLEDRR